MPAPNLRCADVLHALLSHSGIGTATARARCVPWHCAPALAALAPCLCLCNQPHLHCADCLCCRLPASHTTQQVDGRQQPAHAASHRHRRSRSCLHRACAVPMCYTRCCLTAASAALLSHSGIGTATARAVRAMRCSQMPCSGSGIDASRSGIASTESDGSRVNFRPDRRRCERQLAAAVHQSSAARLPHALVS